MKRVVSARCPFDGVVNEVGLLVEVQPGQPTPMMRMCDHFVFEVLTYPAAEEANAPEVSVPYRLASSTAS